MEFENRNFETEYRHNYIPKKIPSKLKHALRREFKDPISESFKHFLTTGEGNIEKKTENYDRFIDRTIKPIKKLEQMYFREPLNKNLIDKIEQDNKKTTYLHDYYISDNYLSKPVAEEVQLPEGWLQGETTQRWSYRNPIILFPDIYKTRPNIIKHSGELEEANKYNIQRRNVSEFTGTIGELGTFILENEMHGKIEKFDIITG